MSARSRALLKIAMLGLIVIAAAALPTLAHDQSEVVHAPSTTGLVITPSQMTRSGDVAACDGSITDPIVATWCSGMPAGTIMLGVDPASSQTAQWNGGQATAAINLGVNVSPTVAVITLSWPDRDGKGLHSPDQGQVGTVAWDSVPVWTKRTQDVGPFGDYYAAQHYAAMTTVVVTDALTHTLSISVPAHTAWDVVSITIDLFPMPDDLHGIAYSPFRDCQNPNWGPFPTEAEVRDDLARLGHTSNGIRTYSTLGINGEIPRIAREYGLPVCAGAWLGREHDAFGNPVPNKNREEIDGLIALAHSEPLDCVIVGNEVLLRGDLTEAELISYINEVQQAVSVPVTTAEISSIFRQHPNVINAVDRVMVHIYPYWDGQPIESAAGAVVAEYQRWQHDYPAKPIVIGETGWPSAGPINGQALPSPENQRHFFYSFLAAAERAHVNYYYFDAIDELWKQEGGVGSHWGYLYSDRTGKVEMQSVLMPGAMLFPYTTYLPLINRTSIGITARSVPNPIAPVRAKPATSDVIVFGEYGSDANQFAPSGWMGDYTDLSFYECERANPHSGQTAVRVSYTPQGADGWAGIYWQRPENNWGTRPNAGLNIDNASALKFFARGAAGGEQVKFSMGGLWGDYPDSQQPALSTDVITLTDQWAEYTIDVRGRNLSNVIGGFAFVADRCLNTQPITFYLDDIRYVVDGDPGLPPPTPTPNAPYAIKVYGDQDTAGNHYVPSGWMGDLGDIGLNTCWITDTHSGSTAIRASYAAQGAGPAVGCNGATPCGWSAVDWQDPANNWGTAPGGLDLRGAKALTFWARGAIGGEAIDFKLGGVGCGTAAYPDSVCPTLVGNPSPTRLTTTWQAYTISLASTLPLSRVVGGFAWAASQTDDPAGATFYLDDIQYLFNTSVPLQTYWVYTGTRLASGFDLGVDTSNGLRTWVTDLTGTLKLSYPAGQQWGSVFITYGKPRPLPRPGLDLAAYSKLQIDLRGEVGGEVVGIGLKDNTDPDDGTETTVPVTLTNVWQTYTFPLSAFTTADRTRLYVVGEVVFGPNAPSTVYARGVRYVP